MMKLVSAKSAPKPPLLDIEEAANVPDGRRIAMTKLADEGVPVRAIARAFQMPCDIVYTVLHEEIASAHLLEIPRDDWPNGQSRGERTGSGRSAEIDEEDTLLEMMRVFRLSKQQAILLNVLLRKKTAPKELLYAAAQTVHEIGEETEPKIVDVVVCKLRKRLMVHGFRIYTIWGGGYYMSLEHRMQALAKIGIDSIIDEVDGVRGQQC